MFTIVPFARRRMAKSGDMLEELETEMNRVMDGFFGRNRRDMTFIPNMDVLEEKDAFVLTLEIPGMNRDDIDISIEEGVLSITGEKKFETREEQEHTWHIIERRYGKFTRTVNIPRATDLTKIAANFKDGLLAIRLPKKPESKPFKVEIK